MLTRRPRVMAALRPLVNRAVPEAMTTVTVRSGPAAGLRLRIEPQLEKFYWTGGHDHEVQAALARVLREGMTCWDVGAHAGFMTLVASRLVGPQGRVVAFEPIEANRRRLEEHLALNGAENVTVVPLALADRSGAATMGERRESSFQWSLDGAREGRPSVNVELATVDDVAARLGVPDVLKIDVEGAELDVIRGARRTIASRRPRMLVEFLEEESMREAQEELPGYRFTRLDSHNYELDPGDRGRAPARSAAILDSIAVVPKDVVHRAFEAETLLLNLETGRYHGVNVTGAELLALLGETGGDVRLSLERLAERLEVEADEIAEDIAQFCTELVDRGLLEVTPK
jgi:FkbM family methyltransferase